MENAPLERKKKNSTSINIKNKEKRSDIKVVKPCTMVLKFSKNTSAKKSGSVFHCLAEIKVRKGFKWQNVVVATIIGRG